MNDPSLTIVPASAGSGKTHFIQDKLAKWVNAGNDPQKIVAVTFTEAAAGEMRSRIRAALVKEKKLDAAMALDSAYISTIHGFGLRLLTEFAFDAGKSPTSRKLNEDEQEMLISRALARSEAAGEMIENLERFGYRAVFSAKNPMTSEQVFRKKVFDFIATLRSIAREQGGNDFIPSVQEKVRVQYGVVNDGAHLKDSLHEAVLNLLQQFDRDISSEVTIGKDATLKLKQNFKDLDAARSGTALENDWQLWKRLGEMLTYKNRGKLPNGYNELAADVNTAALKLELHPGPLEDACLHAKLLIEAAGECLQNYGYDKKERSLLDFTDMLSAALMLVSDETVITELQQRVGILVIDEFQDTNPLQFSLLWALSRRGVPTIIVGDEKQAIMGFQNADPRLLMALPTVPGCEIKPLQHNWRTTKELMVWVNEMGSRLFPCNYEPLGEHEDKETFENRVGAPLEVVDLTTGALRKNEDKASWIASRIYELVTDDTLEVFDKKTKKHRRLKGGDIAILTPVRSLMPAYATALRNAGIPCRYQESGWYKSRIVLIACQALAYIADHDDRHAALCLAVTEAGSYSMESALKVLLDGESITDSHPHSTLRKLAGETIGSTVEHTLLDVIAALRLYETLSRLPDPSQARANLLRLQAECREFTNANRDAMACGGFYGSGIKSFLAWLKEKVERDDMQPDSSIQDENAVEIVTWHSSKGREWPVVAVCGMFNDCGPTLPTVQVEYGENGFDDLNSILEKGAIEIYPEFASPDSNDKFTEALQEKADESATRLLYVAMTRAREKMIIEWPSWTLNSTTRKSTYYIDLFIEKTGASIITETSGQNFMQFNDAEKFPINLKTVTREKGAWNCEDPYQPEELAPIGRSAITPGTIDYEAFTNEIITPSSLHGVECDAVTSEKFIYGGELKIEFSGVTDAMERGKILHRTFEVLSCHPERKELLPDAIGLELESEKVETLAAAVATFDAWMERELNPLSVSAEVPLLVLNDAGSVVHGFTDMIVETADALWVIDHKSDNLEKEGALGERFRIYYPQLKCYADALAKIRKDKPVCGVIINWITAGIITKIVSEK